MNGSIKLGDLVECTEYTDYGDVVEIRDNGFRTEYLVRDKYRPHECRWMDDKHVHRLEGKRHDPSQRANNF